MKKTSSIVKLTIIGVLLAVGLVLSFCPINFGLNKFNSFVGGIKLGLDLKGGVYAVYEADAGDSDNFEQRMDGTRISLENLIVSKNYPEATVVREGSNRLRVEVPDVDNPSEIFSIIGKPASIRFELDDTKETVITGDHILSAEPGYVDGGPVVQLKLNAEGTEKFAKATADNVGKTMSIKTKVEGEEERTISSPKIQASISNGKPVITDMESYDTAKNLADQIMSGTFDVTLSLKESSTISATLGEEALKLGLIAGAVGLFLVILFLCIIYRMFGVVASIALGIYTVLMLLLLSIFPGIQLTLPGIAGIILSLGMAVDGNVIICERIKDEYRNGKSIMASMHAGFKKATIAIVDSNVTTIIAALLLLIFGTGSISGFAATLLIGIVLSMFSSLLITRGLAKYFVNINSTKASLYNLKRGKGYESIEAGATDSKVAELMAKEAAEKEKIKEEKKKQRKEKEGGFLDEQA